MPVADQIVLPASARGYVLELMEQVKALSERAANLAANLAVAKEQNDLNVARIVTLQDEIARLKQAVGD
jgi:hypothetical protein